MSEYEYDCDSEFEEWWAKNGDDRARLYDKDAAREVFQAGANMERCHHRNVTPAKSRDWCHDCCSWVYRKS